MSVILTLTSCAIIAAASLSSTVLMAVAIATGDERAELAEKGLETQYVDCELLVKTLNGFDCHIKQLSENEIHVSTTAGNLIYRRDSIEEPFRMYLDEITDAEALIENIRSLEVDYKRNVQAYTYDHIRKNLTDDMTIVEETVMEDDAVYLTINIE